MLFKYSIILDLLLNIHLSHWILVIVNNYFLLLLFIFKILWILDPNANEWYHFVIRIDNTGIINVRINSNDISGKTIGANDNIPLPNVARTAYLGKNLEGKYFTFSFFINFYYV